MTYAATVLADSPVVYYRLGDASGTTMTDSSGNARNGTYGGSPTLGAAGLLTGDSDTAVSFTPSSQYGSTAYAAWMDLGTLTVEALVNMPSTAANQYIASRDGSNRVWGFQVNANKVTFYVIDTSGSSVVATGTTVLAGSTTYHVAGTYDGFTASVYVNGALDGSTNATAVRSAQARSVDLYVARYSLSPFYSMSGTIDEFALYGSALSSTRIATHYTAATGGGGGGTPRGIFRMADALRRQAVIRASSY